MDITLSEAPNLLSNRPVLTPALVSVQAFFYVRNGMKGLREGRYRPRRDDSGQLWLRIVLQRQQQAIAAHSGASSG
jgi:hypothetical protein